MPLAAWVARLVTVELADDEESMPVSTRAQMVARAPSSFCAICTGDGPLVERPLGKGGALVSVCERCDTEHPRSGRISFVESSKAPSRPAKAKGVPA
jgi:hypothetical protein